MNKQKNKKIDRQAMLNFVVNFCAIFSLIFMFGMLVLADEVGRDSVLATVSEPISDSNLCAHSDNSTDSPAVLFPVLADNPAEGSVKIVVNDSGYVDKRMVLSAGETKMLEVINKGVNPHSFVIDGMMIDSGAINPGQTKTIALENLSGELRNYTFYSNLAGDDKDKFSGIFIFK